MSFRKDQIEDEITRLKEEIRVLAEKGSRTPDASTSELIRYLIDEREKTNRAIGNLMSKVSELDKTFREKDAENQEYMMPTSIEIPLSRLEVNLLNFIKTNESEMVCADDVKEFMKYNGRNAACARLKKLEDKGFLVKFQLGHKVYYKYDAGKTTKTLIISPPQ